MADDKIFKVTKNWTNKAFVNSEKYKKLYDESIKNNEKFWEKEGLKLTWFKPFTKIKDVKYSSKEVSIKWYYDGTLNASVNCIDRHAKNNPNKIAIIWEGDDPKNSKKITYSELLINVSKTANVLKKNRCSKR